jgi:predicted dehydrogenase
MAHSVAVVGTGPDPDDPDLDGFAMAYQHAEAYEAIDDCELVACADIVPENAAAFAREHGLDEGATYEDYEAMLADAEPSVVSICVPPAAHADLTLGCLRAPSVEAVHCEKPMTLRFDEARLVTQEADRLDTQLTYNHQRRYGAPFRQAKELLDAGAVGDLRRVEFGAGNLYDYGTHSFDLSNYFAGEAQPEWVLCGLDYATENAPFGAHNETQSVVVWEYETGVSGLATTDQHGESGDVVGCHNRLVGTDGVIEVGPSDDVHLRLRRDGEGWEERDTGGEHMHGPGYIERALRDVVSCLDAGEPCELRAENALNATELIFGAWESARRRGRVEFPLTVDDNPLEAMIESGNLSADDGE